MGIIMSTLPANKNLIINITKFYYKVFLVRRKLGLTVNDLTIFLIYK